MARNREGLVLLLDVGPPMHGILPEVEKACSLLIEKKLIFNKYDEVGVIFFGTEETRNELARDIGGYEHVIVSRQIKAVDENLVEDIQQLPRGTVAADFLDALIVGMDMMIKKYGPTEKGKKRLCLITNAVCPTKDPFEGTKEDQVSTIATKMAAEGIKMESIVVRGNLSGDSDQKIMDENDHLLKLLSSRASARIVYVESPLSLLGALKTRRIAPVTVFRGDLEINPELKIKVWVYKKVSEERLPTLKKYSDKAPPTDEFAQHEVKVDYEYKVSGESSQALAPEERIKGYRYGPQVVPISSDQMEALKFKPEKGIKLLGFTDASNIFRHEPGKTKSVLAASAIARAMSQANKVAILRCVWRKGQGNVVIGVLTPNVSDRADTPDSFYFNVLPFAEDVREFPFPSFSRLPASLKPDEQQQAAADNLVKMLDLAPSGREEVLKPDLTPNPVLQRFYRFLELKSKSPDAALPPLDKTLKGIMDQDSELLLKSKFILDAFRGSFELKENPRLKKASKLLLREKPSGSDDENDRMDVEAENKSLVDKIRDANPVQDFEAMMSRRDSPDWVDKAIVEMKNKILKLIEEPDGEDKALACLLSLRKSCVLEQEPKQFNNFLRHLYQLCVEKNLTCFLKHLTCKKVMLIPKSEAEDSDVADEEAKDFPVKREPMPDS
ncbi:PREDICTED: ATP-dependent DNA helicase 2 subunit KU80 [Tarenaya hassleriana]|uniref:ATP-dependent DNA helicase 2 subunit KU80 n=1 Tax=Tarenaya hassleriana TaxID=28532 RepID=UPI00053CA267|nr:PREDICTED: ATP-dependent DNA helicase 2 subunit KU80 [Tarenaya hassleriana]